MLLYICNAHTFTVVNTLAQRMMLLSSLVLLTCCSLFGNQNKETTFSKTRTAKEVGAILMQLPQGLHSINHLFPSSTAEKPQGLVDQPQHLSVLVHGYKSRGYEWSYAAERLSEREPVYFFRWDWTLCPQAGALKLSQSLRRLSTQHPNIEIRVFGHSYGGVILAISAAQYNEKSPLKAHLIASPLAGHPQLETRCDVSITALTAPHRDLTPLQKTGHGVTSTHQSQVTLTQWRTVKALDGAFKEMEVDPQVVQWRGKVFTLPKSYRGKRLGHNWSISAAIDLLLGGQEPKLDNE